MMSMPSLSLATLSTAATLLLGAGTANAQADLDHERDHDRGHRTVFARYLVTNQDYQSADPSAELKIAAYEKEIRQAQGGIDGSP
jgi:hypothetical protein